MKRFYTNIFKLPYIERTKQEKPNLISFTLWNHQSTHTKKLSPFSETDIEYIACVVLQVNEENLALLKHTRILN